ncbi:MAG: hypothetical protein LBD87_06190 [Prevotellaceae bacterium]|jgi:transposase InsO family protein|nr:hypothetical protein [Prevotellaceae bacterium]
MKHEIDKLKALHKKNEHALNSTFADYGQARRAGKEAIWLYNTRRSHSFLGFKTPEEAHRAA